MKRKRRLVATAALVLGMASLSAARAYETGADPTVKSSTASLADLFASSGLTEAGYLAASYHHSNGYPANIHQFDVDHDTFQLDQAGLQVAYQPKDGFGALVNVIAGEDARILHAAEDGRDESFEVLQAFIQYATGPVTLIAGKYVTLAGAETINPTTNTNFSRSLLFFQSQPLTHTGIRATYAVSDTLSIIGGINNGWNTTSTSYGSKTGELGVAWIPNKAFSLTSQAYFGKTKAYDAQKTLVDVVATYNVTSELTLIVNFDWNQQRFAPDSAATASWDGVALYVNYAFNDRWRVSLRAEYLDDKDGFLTGSDQALREGTLTVGYAPVKGFELRLESRYDKAQENAFYKTSAALDAALPNADSLMGIALQGVYKF